MVAFSRRTALAHAETNALARALAARDPQRPYVDLTLGNPTRAGLPYDADSITSALASPASLVYEPHPFGLPAARAAIARSEGVDPARVVLTASTSEAYAFLFKALCDPGDDVLVPAPSYPLFEHLAAFEAVRLVPYRLAYDGAWHVDFPSLAAARTPRTRAVMLVSPNNPTGSFVKQDELARLGALGLPLVSDEVFARYVLDDAAARGRAATALAAAEHGAPLVVALGGLSKLAALPQMKLAWSIVGGADEGAVASLLARLELVCDAFLSVGTPVQHALPALLASAEPMVAAIGQRTRANLATLRAALVDSPATVLRAEGGWYAVVELPRTQSEEDWAVELLERDGVLVHPGAFFDFEREAYAVLSLLPPPDELARGAARLADAMRRHA